MKDASRVSFSESHKKPSAKNYKEKRLVLMEECDRIQFKKTAFVIDRDYIESRKLPKEALDACFQDHNSVQTRYERIRRQYKGKYRKGVETSLREQNAELSSTTFCVAAAATVLDADVESVKVISNATKESAIYENKPEPEAVEVSHKLTHVMKGIVIDDQSNRAGLGGLLVAAAIANPKLLDDTSVLDNPPKMGAPLKIKPGLVLCRAKEVLSEDDVENLDPTALAVLNTERHLLVTMLGQNPPASSVVRICSFAWSGNQRAFVLSLQAFRSLMASARQIADHLSKHVVKIGEGWMKVTKGPENGVELDVLADYVRICAAPDLLYRTGDASGAFRSDRPNMLYMCARGGGDRKQVVSRLADEDKDLFDAQCAFARIVSGLAKPEDRETKTKEQLVMEYVISSKKKRDEKKSTSPA